MPDIFAPAEPWTFRRKVPTGVLMSKFREWVRTLNANERKLLRDHFESEGGFDGTEEGREFMEILRKET